MSGGKYDTLKDKIFNSFKAMKDRLDDHVLSGDHDDRYYQRSESDVLLGGKTDLAVFNAAMDNAHVERLGVESRAAEYALQAVLDGINTVVKYNPVIVEDPAEVEYQKGQEESFSDVFANWLRISHGSNNQYPSNPGELNSWTYDAGSNRIACTVNSATLVGFISLDRFDTYNFELLAKSNNSDDDGIGACIAFTELDGREYTLTVIRNTGGLGGANGRFQIVYNYLQSDSAVIAETSSGLSTGIGWNTLTSGVKIRIERVGDLITCKTTDTDGVTWVTAAELSINLANIPLLSKFRGPQQYGYVAHSQANSSWETLARPIALSEIVDIQNGVRWDYDGNDWTSTPIPVGEVGLESKRFYFNEQTQKLYFTDEDGQPRRILLPDHALSDDHDNRYYTKDEVNNLLPGLVQAELADGHQHPWSQITNAPATATRWPAWAEVTAKPATFPPSTHNHNDLYYTQTQLDGYLGNKVDKVVGMGLSENDLTDALKSKLDGIAAGAQVNVGTNLSFSLTTDTVVITSSTGNNATVPAATTTQAGAMSSADKVKLDGIATGAEANLPTTASRTSSATGTVLQAKGMNDHRTSGDHDGRYHTKTELASLLGDKLNVADVLNVLTSSDASKALSAAQGKALKDEVDLINVLLQSDTATLDSLQEVVDFIQLNRADLDSLGITSIAGLQAALNGKVNTVSGKGLSTNDFTAALLAKLNGIEAGAQVNVGTNLGASRNATSYTLTSSTGSNVSLAEASTTVAGVFSAADKVKLNGIAVSANNYSHPTSGFTMAALTAASVISQVVVDSTGHISSVSTRNLTKANLGLSNVPNVDATNAGNLSAGTVPSARLTGTYGISISGLSATATKLATARTINGVAFDGTKNIVVEDNTKVKKSGDTMTGRLNIGGVDDGVNELQVDGETSLRGNVGVNNSDASFAVDVNGDIRVRDGFAIKFGGVGANDAKFELRYNAVTQTLDFNYLG